MEDVHLLVGLVALLTYALLSRGLERWWISMPTAMLLAGVVLGTAGLGLVGVNVRGELVKSVAEITLALMLFHDAVRIDLRALRTGYSLPLRLLGIGLPLMLVVGTAVAYGMMPGLGLVGAALISTMLAPTDAALGEAVVEDERLPLRIRQGLNVESGLNDGLSVPVFVVLLAVAADPGGLESGALLAELVRQIGYGVAGGALLGGVGGLLFKAAARRDLMIGVWRRIAILAIAVGSFACAVSLGGSGFIGAFSGGVLFGLASEARSTSDNALTGYLGTAFDALSFLLVGAVVLPYVFEFLTWQVVAYAVLSLVVIRPLVVAIALAGSGADRRTVAFAGWFGPRGLATLVFAVMLLDADVLDASVITATAVVGVTLSVIAHGFSAPPLVARYAKWWAGRAAQGEDRMEGEAVHAHANRP